MAPSQASTLRDLVELHVVNDPSFDQNCYVLHRRDTDAALVFDPGLQHPQTLQLLEEKSWRCERILLTHGHPDHVNGVPAVIDAHKCHAAIHPEDRELLPLASRFPMMPPDLVVECDEDLTVGEVVGWQGLDVKVLATPGHTKGSVCFLIGPDLLSGDTLFRKSVGRTDLPGGSWETLVFSIENTLYELPPETVVHPGHGASTTIDVEMRTNPFVPDKRYR